MTIKFTGEMEKAYWQDAAEQEAIDAAEQEARETDERREKEREQYAGY